MTLRTFLQRTLIAGAVLIASACDGDSDSETGPEVDLKTEIIGTWKIMKSSGVDVSALGGTYTVDAATILENWPSICSKSYSYTLSGNTLSTTVTANSCTFDGSNEPVGYKGTATIEISGHRMTVRIPSTGAIGELERV